MAEVKWIKLTTDMFDNRKIKHLRRLPDGNNIVLLWIMLLTMAGRCNAGGMIFLTENIPYTPKMLADELGFEENTVILGLQALDQLNMVVTKDSCFTISGWEEYQNADKLAELRAKDRERKRLKRAEAMALTDNSTDIPRTFHGHSTDCPHIEKEEEKEKDLEFHSLTHDGAEKRLELMGGSLGQGVVLLSEEQKDDLLEKLSIDEFNKYVGIVAECELKGKKFKKKSHYQAILDMVAKDRAVLSPC